MRRETDWRTRVITSYSIHYTKLYEESVNVALIQPNLDPYTEKFDPQNYARHMDAFFRTAEAVVDSDTQYLLGPETLIVEQIDEDDPKK